MHHFIKARENKISQIWILVQFIELNITSNNLRRKMSFLLCILYLDKRKNHEAANFPNYLLQAAELNDGRVL